MPPVGVIKNDDHYIVYIAEIGPFVQPITDQVVAVGETAKFECCLHQPSSSCDVTWSVFLVKLKHVHE